MPAYTALGDFEPDHPSGPAVALDLALTDYAAEIPLHQHHRGQLVVALHGAVTCKVAQSWWIAPPTSGIWVPGGVPHSNLATGNARLSLLFVDPGAANLPEHCCTLAISPMIREMIQQLAQRPAEYSADSHTARLVRVLLDELAMMPREALHLPVPAHPKIRQIAEALSLHPEDPATMAQWAARVATSERTLARLLVQETGLTFGRWRRQLHLMVALRELSAGVSVQRVSETLGYESVTAFITMFKKALGKTPTHYLAERQYGGLATRPVEHTPA